VLTAIPARLLHRLHDLAAAVLVLTDLGLELLCDQHQHQHQHDGALHELEGSA
jgi:hypothetical protein